MQTLIESFYSRVEKSGFKVALKSKRNGSWESKSWDETGLVCENLAYGLLSLGLNLGDRVAILAQSREEWFFADMATILSAGCTVPIYPSNTGPECAYIIDNSSARFVFVENQDQYEKLKNSEVDSKIEKYILFDGSISDAKVVSLLDLLKTGESDKAADAEKLKKVQSEIKPDNLLTIIYTSGTTGPPKGVMLSHKNITAEINSIGNIVPLKEDDEQLLLLPMAHVFARVISFVVVHTGMICTFAESIEKVAANMQEVKPTFMGAVPRIFEKVFDKINANIDATTGFKKSLVLWSLETGKAYHTNPEGRSFFLNIKYAIANKLVLSKLRDIFGGRIRFFVSGGAPLSAQLADFFLSIGLVILEGYGLTETTGATHFNRPDGYKFGTVGQQIDGVEVKIADDGEILVRGDNIMDGYYKNEAATNEVFSDGRWFHTGDIGVVDDQGYLKITDRKKDIIITAGGKNVAPQNIENRLKMKTTISQVAVHGDKRKYLSALITLSPDFLEEYKKKNDLPSLSYSDASKRDDILALVQSDLDSVNGELASYETIKKFHLLDKDLTQEDGELTPTLKLKRKIVNQKYKNIFDSLY